MADRDKLMSMGMSWPLAQLVGYLSGSGTPVSSKTPDFIGQLYRDSTNNDFYVSTGISNTDWAIDALSALNASGTELNSTQMDTKMTIFEDFHGVWVDTDSEPATNWLVGIGNGTTPVKATTVSNSINGEVTLKSATAAGAGTAVNSLLTGANLGYKAEKGGLVVEARLKIDDIVEAYIFVGFTDAIASTKNDPISFTDGSDTPISDAANAAGIVFTGDSTTQEWHGGGVKAGSDTPANFSGTAPTNGTYVVLRVELNATGVLSAYVDGTQIGSDVAAAITASTAITPAIIVGNTASAQTIMTLDYIWVQQNR